MPSFSSAAWGACRAVRFASAAAIVLLAAARALATTGHLITLPSGKNAPSGLQLSVYNHGIDANGYRPLEIQVKPRPATKPFAADRQIRVVLEFDRYGAQAKTRVSQVIELPEKSTGAAATILVPQTCNWNQLSLETFEGGEKLLDLSQDYVGWPSYGWSWTEARPAVLFIESKVPPLDQLTRSLQAFASSGVDPAPTYELPDVRAFLANFPDVNQPVARPGVGPKTQINFSAPQISDTALFAFLWPRSRTAMVGFEQLRTSWLELSQFDVAVISLADLTQLARTQKTRFAALRDWLSTGPLLIVYGVGQEYERLEELERLLELPPLPPRPSNSATLRGWEPPSRDDDIGVLITPFWEDDGNVPSEEADGAEAGKKAESDSAAAEVASAPFVRRSAGLGCLVAVPAAQPFPGKQSEWAWLFNSVPDRHWKWYKRTGLSLQRTNNDYWKFLIPGVGEAPVIPFTILVTLFAIVIGPVNFFWLRRRRRLYLLLLTVPAAAILVTASLVAFAFLSDGTRVRVRIRSFADFDQTTGRAAVWSRQSYYAALAPSQGLTFPPDSAVYPLLYEPGDRSSDRTTLVHWDGDQQLRRGFLLPRTATQFMVCRATSSPVKLAVREPAGSGMAASVENRLTTMVRYVAVRTRTGEYFAASAIGVGEQRRLDAADPARIRKAIRAIAEPLEPRLPADYDPQLHDDNLLSLISGNRNYLPNDDGALGDPAMSSSILEMNLIAATYLYDSRRPLPDDLGLQPGAYLAIVERSPFVVPGVPQAREEASLHVIRGRY